MNAVTNASSSHDFLHDNTGGGGSDSDTSPDELPEYYQPISTDSNSDDDDENTDHQLDLPNGYAHFMENGGVSSLDLSDEEDEDSEKEEEEERTRAESDVAIRRAFRQDQSRRNAPLTPENAVRVMDAMRGVSFAGLTPDWADRIPEHQWIDQLRNLRGPPPPA
ncbi:hypothetical protein ACH5RR_010260 [Cinchona calisaya]|uniref:Uncharacterized protein n=1 Tax=Cinchona calisaya TaxID=153742 RepID=A0ABD3AH33_9GENT